MLLGPPQVGRALTFEDQYISSGGQLYELVMRHRWTVDLRPLHRATPSCGQACPGCAVTLTISHRARVTRIASGGGSRPGSTSTATSAWVGYANATLRNRNTSPVLHAQLRAHGLWPA